MVDDKFYIYHHLGLGDHIICSGIVRNIYSRVSKNIVLFCKPVNAETVRFMYRDLGITIHETDDHQVKLILQSVPKEKKIYVGHHHLMENIINTTFDCAFYKQVGLDFKRRWTDFYVERDIKREEVLFDKLKLPKEYIFVHDDTSRYFNIRSEFLKKDVKVVRPEHTLTGNIFDYLTVLEREQEIHCIDSCFRLMVDSCIDKTDNLFFHFNLQGNIIKDRTYAQSRLPWRVI